MRNQALNSIGAILTTAAVFLIIIGMLSFSSPSFGFSSSVPSNNLVPGPAVQITSVINGLTTYNWAGYKVNGPYHSVTDVMGTWVVPNVVCSSQPTSSVSWIGIDDANPTLVQIGTGSNCVGGRVVTNAWYVFICCTQVGIKHTVKPNDLIKAEVKYSNGKFTQTLKDVTQGWTLSLTKAVSGAQRSSAEWIIERPQVCTTTCSLTSLANFGIAYWSNDKATISDHTGYVGQFQKISTDTVYFINMVAPPPSGANLADTSSLASFGDFSITWISSR